MNDFILKILGNFDIEEGNSFQVLYLSPDLIVVDTLEGWHVPGSVPLKRVSLRGNLESFAIADIISMVNFSKKTGILSFVFSESTKSLFFLKGDIVFATSSLPRDRLGESLVKAGKITREQLEAILKEGRGGGVLGKLLVEKGFLSPKELFLGVKRQVEEIIYSLFLLKKGVFFFFEGEFPLEGLTKISMSAQNLVMEGIRRVDEWSVFLEKIPVGQLVLVKKKKLPEINLKPVEKGVFEHVDGKSTVEEICRKSGLGEFETYAHLFHLLSAGFVEYSSGEDVESI